MSTRRMLASGPNAPARPLAPVTAPAPTWNGHGARAGDWIAEIPTCGPHKGWPSIPARPTTLPDENLMPCQLPAGHDGRCRPCPVGLSGAAGRSADRAPRNASAPIWPASFWLHPLLLLDEPQAGLTAQLSRSSSIDPHGGRGWGVHGLPHPGVLRARRRMLTCAWAWSRPHEFWDGRRSLPTSCDRRRSGETCQSSRHSPRPL